MTHYEEQALMLCCSLYLSKPEWLTPEEMQTRFDWLNNISLYGIDIYLQTGWKKNYILSREREGGTNGELEYQASAHGYRTYEQKIS